MCRMLITKNPKLPMNYRENGYMDFLSFLCSRGGNGGTGVMWYDKDVQLNAAKNVYWNNWFDNEEKAFALLSMLSVEAHPDYPYVIHLRGPVSGTIHNHPHSSDAKWEVPDISRAYFAKNMPDGLVHNGDASLLAMKRLREFMVEETDQAFPESRLIDTQMMTYFIAHHGIEVLRKFNPFFGSIIYTRPQDRVPEFWIYRDLMPQNDYTSLYLLRWDDDSWMIASEFKLSYLNEGDVYRINKGLWRLEEITSLNKEAVGRVDNPRREFLR